MPTVDTPTKGVRSVDDHIADRLDIREFRRALDELFASLLDSGDPQTPEWEHTQLHRLTTQLRNTASKLRRAGLRVQYLGFGSVEISAEND